MLALPLLVLSTLSFAALAGTQDPDTKTHPKYVHLKLRSGTDLRAFVLEKDGERYRLQLSVGGGTSSGWYDFGAFEDESQVRILESMVAEDDVAAQFAVAEFAMDKGLTEMARRELRRCSHMAENLDPDHHQKLGPRAIALTVKLIDAYAELGKLSEARNGVHRMLVRRADQLTSDQKQQLVKALDDATARQAAKRDAEREKKAEEKQARERDRRLEPVVKHLDEANELRREGLLCSEYYMKASRLLERAEKKYASVLKDVEKLTVALGQDPTAMAQLQRISDSASKQLL